MRSLLLDLPLEIVLQIIENLEPVSFSAVLITCKALRNHILDSTTTIKRQIWKLPGLSEALSGYNNIDLLRRFNSHAHLHLQNSVGLLVDSELWTPSFLRDSKNCVFAHCDKCRHLILATPAVDDATICIYFLDKNGITLEHIIKPSPCLDGNSPKVVKLTFRSTHEVGWSGCVKDLAVLYRYIVDGKPHQDLQVNLYRFERGRFDGYLLSTLHVGKLGDRASALYVSRSFTVVIAAQYEQDGKRCSRLLAYPRVSNDPADETWTYDMPQLFTLENLDVAVSRLSSQSERILNVYSSSLPVFSYRFFMDAKALYAPKTVYTRLLLNQFLFAHSISGELIANLHHCDLWDPERKEHYCINTALGIYFSRQLPHKYGGTCHPGAFLVKIIQYPPACQAFLDDGTNAPMDHIVLAELEGIDVLDMSSSLGLRMAVSDGSKRVAMATWKTVLVWAFDPNVFLSASDSQCGDGYYRCNRKEDGIIMLEPLLLPEMGVVFGLAFRGDDELWAWTELGLVRWSIGPSCNKTRLVRALDTG